MSHNIRNYKREIHLLNRTRSIVQKGIAIKPHFPEDRSIVLQYSDDSGLHHIAHIYTEDGLHYISDTDPSGMQHLTPISRATVYALSYASGVSISPRSPVIIVRDSTDDVLVKAIEGVKDERQGEVTFNAIAKLAIPHGSIRELEFKLARMKDGVNVVAATMLDIEGLISLHPSTGRLKFSIIPADISDVAMQTYIHLFSSQLERFERSTLLSILVQLSQGMGPKTPELLDQAMDIVLSNYHSSLGRAVVLEGLRQLEKILMLQCAISQAKGHGKPVSFFRGRGPALKEVITD